jgi:hypothetical protein
VDISFHHGRVGSQMAVVFKLLTARIPAKKLIGLMPGLRSEETNEIVTMELDTNIVRTDFIYE